jgi:hypothetical protein
MIIIITVVLSLGSTNDQEHVIFGFWSLVHLTHHDDLQFYLFPANDNISFFLKAEQYSIIYTRIFLTHLSVVGFLG